MLLMTMENIVLKVKTNRTAEEKQVIDEFVTRVRETLDERAKRIISTAPVHEAMQMRNLIMIFSFWLSRSTKMIKE